jgi:DegV family protein with EDD domain
LPRIKVVTDSASDLPEELLKAHAITAVPLDVRLGDAGPEEMRSLSAEEFWRRAAATTALPETSAPAPGAFAEAFLTAQRDGYDGVCCITISSALSATYQAACAGVTALESAIPVEVVDSRFATLGEGLLVLEAAQHAEAGEDLQTVATAVREAIEKTQVFGTLDTLDNLRRGGRIGSAQALVGSLLSIKPVIEVRDGVVEGESRQRTRARSLRYLVDKVAAGAPLRRLGVAHAEAEDLDVFLSMLDALELPNERIVGNIGPVIGAHTGQGTVGVCLQRA